MSSDQTQQAQNTSQSLQFIQHQPQASTQPATNPSPLNQEDWTARITYLASIGYQYSSPIPLRKLTKQDFVDQCLRLQDFVVEKQRALAREYEINAARSARERELEEREEKLRRREELVEWGFEQQEAVLREAMDQGVELAGVVIEQRLLKQIDMVEDDDRGDDVGEVAGGSEHTS